MTSIIADAEDAIRASVQSVEDQYSALTSGEAVNTCEFFDGCDNPPLSSETGAEIPNWQTSGTQYHTFCGNGTSVVTNLPEAPACDPLQSTVCGLDVSFDRATIKFLTDTDFSDNDVQQAICVQRNLDTEWHTSFAGILDYNNYVEYVYSTVGATGMLMQFPGVEWGSCPSSYDPRFRPWYAAASVGPKNVVLVIDVSGSMADAGRMALAKQAAKAVLGTLNDYDFVTIVTFSRSATAYSSTLLPFTTNTKCVLEDYIDSLRTESTTNYEAAFSRAFSVLSNSKTTGDFSSCGPTAVLFLTDGDVTAGAEGSELYDDIEAQRADTDAVIFTYALGSGVDSSVTKTIACQSGGAAYEVADGDDLATVMASYFDFFAGQVVPESIAPVWTRYREYNSGQFAASVCMSAHDEAQYEEIGVTRLLGVVCADLSEAHVADVDGSLDSFTSAITRSSTQCPTFIDPTDEELELIRTAMPGSPLMCTTPWWHWGIPVIIIGTAVLIGIVAAVVVNAARAKNKTKNTTDPPTAVPVQRNQSNEQIPTAHVVGGSATPTFEKA